MNTTSAARGPVHPGRRVVLVRHGATAANLAGRFLGRGDPPLTDDALAAACRLAPVAERLAPSAVVSSPAIRALDTARALGLGEPDVDAGFREVDFGEWEGLTFAEVARHDPAGYERFDKGEIEGFPGGEAVAAVADRAAEALARHGATPLLVVAHASVIRILVATLLGLPVVRYRALLARPAHLSWTEVEAHQGAWRLVRYGAASPTDPGDGAS